MRESATLKCPKCKKSFRVLEDEQFDHDCPYCGGPEEEIEHWGIDVMGDEILIDDDIVLDPYGEVILESNLKDYLIEHLGFVFKKAE